MARFKDSRFTISKQFCGYSKAKHVLFYCGIFLAPFDTWQEASNARIAAVSLHNEYLFLNESTAKGLGVDFVTWYKSKQQGVK